MAWKTCISVFCPIVLCVGYAGEPNKDAASDSFDLQCVGHWSSETVWTVAYDAERDLAFLGSCGCVHIVDVTFPAQPKKIGAFRHSACNACGLDYQQDTRRLYICSGMTGMSIWNIADPSNPSELGRYDTPGYACGVDVAGPYAYVADGDGGLRIIDVSAPARPVEVRHLNMEAACCVHIQDHYAYVADLGLRIIDVADPRAPVEIAFCQTPGVAYGVHVNGSYAYVADDWCGLRVIDISDPRNPHEIGCTETPGYAWNVYVKGSFAYVSACDAGLYVIDVRDPTTPRSIAHYATTNDALHAYVTGSHVYVASAAGGLQIYANHAIAGKKQ